jgi:hypothetical protein
MGFTGVSHVCDMGVTGVLGRSFRDTIGVLHGYDLGVSDK